MLPLSKSAVARAAVSRSLRISVVGRDPFFQLAGTGTNLSDVGPSLKQTALLHLHWLSLPIHSYVVTPRQSERALRRKPAAAASFHFSRNLSAILRCQELPFDGPICISAIREAQFDFLVIPNQGADAASACIETARRHFSRIFFNEVKRCGTKTRSSKPCLSPGMANGRCRMQEGHPLARPKVTRMLSATVDTQPRPSLGGGKSLHCSVLLAPLT
jgi:hypothetical protein